MGTSVQATPQSGLSAMDINVSTIFVENDDVHRYAKLVREFSPMVLGVCRRMLPDADAEDAAQAVFILFWQNFSKASSHANVAGWLHRSAVLVCRNAIRSRMKRRQREREIDSSLSSAQIPPDMLHHWAEVRAMIDEEVNAMPESLRLPFILFHLEGNTLEEVSKATGSNVSSVGTRLQRVRKRLAGRLQRRGVGLEVATIAALICSQSLVGTASEGFPESVLATTASIPPGQSLASIPMAPDVRSLLKGEMPRSISQRVGMAAMGSFVLAFCICASLAWWQYDVGTRNSPSFAGLQGEWHQIYQEQDGKQVVVPSEVEVVSVLQIDGNQFRRFQKVADGRVLGREAGRIQLNETTQPSQIDFRFWTASIYGVFELQGDELLVCVTANSGARPVNLTTVHGDDRMFVRYRRAGNDKIPQP